jgi:hypothetical protein
LHVTKPTRTLGRANPVLPLAVCAYAQPANTTRLWPCNSAWQFNSVSLACASWSIRGFHRSRLRTWRAFPPFGFVPSQALLSSCVASHLQLEVKFPLDRALLLLNSQWPLLVSASISAHFHFILQSSHSSLSTLPRVTTHSLFLPCTSSKFPLQKLTVRVAESTNLRS